jgi:ribosomal protein L10
MTKMNANKIRKTNHLNKISDLKKNFNAVVMVSHSKLPNEMLAQLRDSMFLEGNKVLFIKNKIANLSFKNEEFKGSLENPNFLIFGNDIFSIIKSFNIFLKTLKVYPDTKISLMAGFLDNGFLNQAEIKSLEKIPSKESLYVGILGTLLYPMRTLVRLLDKHTQNNQDKLD